MKIILYHFNYLEYINAILVKTKNKRLFQLMHENYNLHKKRIRNNFVLRKKCY